MLFKTPVYSSVGIYPTGGKSVRGVVRVIVTPLANLTVMDAIVVKIPKCAMWELGGLWVLFCMNTCMEANKSVLIYFQE